MLHDKSFPERTSPNEIDSSKLSSLFIELQIALSKDLETIERIYTPGLRLAMNELLELDKQFR